MLCGKERFCESLKDADLRQPLGPQKFVGPLGYRDALRHLRSF